MALWYKDERREIRTDNDDLGKYLIDKGIIAPPKKSHFSLNGIRVSNFPLISWIIDRLNDNPPNAP